MLIRPFEKSDRKGLYRAFASEGVVGNFGIYRSKKYRTLNVYTSRDTNWVLIETRQGKKIVISPDDISLVEKVSDYLP